MDIALTGDGIVEPNDRQRRTFEPKSVFWLRSTVYCS